MKVFIGCGSNPKINSNYLDETKRVCELLCEMNYDLVFGAYSLGMMGVCYNTFIQNKRHVYGISLDAYEDDLVNLKDMDSKCFDNSFDRLKKIFKESDLFLILPGGTGTYGELFGLLEEFKTNKGDKRLILYNYNHFFDDLLKYLQKNLELNFMYENDLDNIIIINNLNDLEGVLK